MMKPNYIVTAHKPSVVTHSCVGHFTSSDDVNLIIAKTNVIEVFKLSDQVLKPMLDVQIYGRIIAMELFPLHGHKQEVLFVATHLRYSFLEWNSEAGEVITRSTGEVRACDDAVVISPFGRMDRVRSLIGLHVFREYFEVIPFNISGQFMEAYKISLWDDVVLDIQFLCNYPVPTIAVLYRKAWNGAYYVEMHVDVVTPDPLDESPSGRAGRLWSVPDSCEYPRFLLPVPVTPPSVALLSGVLVLGTKSIVYCDVSGCTISSNVPAAIRSYCLIDSHELTYMVADIDGLLYKLEISRDDMNTRVTELKLEFLGQTSIRAARPISYLGQQLVFVGSTYGDSQLIKLNSSPDAEGPRVKALDSYVNIGPIQNLCVVDLEGQRTVVTTSGIEGEAFLRVMRQGFKINKLASTEANAITGIWSLGSSTDRFDKFLVVSYSNVTRVLEMKINNKLEETQIEGFSSQVQTLFCHNVAHGQLIQVTKDSVRLVSLTSGELRAEYVSDCSISTSTANLTKVLLAGERQLVCLQVSDGEVKELKRANTGPDVSCLYIKRIADSELAAVGMWDESVVIFSLPDFEFLTRTCFSTKPESVLICEFEGIPHLLCGLRDGHLLILTLDLNTYQLTNLKEVSCGSLPITLRTYSAKNTTLVFAASERPFVIYSNKKILLEDKLDLKDICNMCPFNSAAFPDSIAVAGSDELTICRIDYQMMQILSIQVQNVPRCFCYQDYSRTFAFCSESTEHIGCIDLLNDQSFEIISSYSLEKLEVGVSIVSCSLSHSNDNNVYYCVGTGYSDSDSDSDSDEDEDEERKGRILVFEAENRELVLVAKKEFSVRVRSLTPFNGKVLACLEDSEYPTNYMDIHLYMLDGGGLQLESKINVHTYSYNREPSLKARGNVIVGVGSFLTHILNKPETGDFKLIAGNYERDSAHALSVPYKAANCLFNGNRSVAVEVLNDDLFLRADGMCNICTFKKDNDTRCNHIPHGRDLSVNVVQDILMDGRFHLGYQVTHFWRGSLLQMPDSTVRQIPTLVFGTLEGAIGVMASLPLDDFSLLLDLQSKLREFIKGVGDFSHEQFRSYYSTEKGDYSGTKMEVEDDEEMCRTFIDGDFIELFLDLPSTRRQEVAEAMNEPVEELTKRVEKLKMLH